MYKFLHLIRQFAQINRVSLLDSAKFRPRICVILLQDCIDKLLPVFRILATGGYSPMKLMERALAMQEYMRNTGILTGPLVEIQIYHPSTTHIKACIIAT